MFSNITTKIKKYFCHLLKQLGNCFSLPNKRRLSLEDDCEFRVVIRETQKPPKFQANFCINIRARKDSSIIRRKYFWIWNLKLKWNLKWKHLSCASSSSCSSLSWQSLTHNLELTHLDLTSDPTMDLECLKFSLSEMMTEIFKQNLMQCQDFQHMVPALLTTSKFPQNFITWTWFDFRFLLFF